jgi:hypothetical protein
MNLFKVFPFAIVRKRRALSAWVKDAQNKLDRIMDIHGAEPVGNGYAEIIVPRNRCRAFVKDVLSDGFRITGITWHEQCDSIGQSKYGMAVYHSRLSEVVFSEIPIGDDDVISLGNTEETHRGIMDIIENKEIRFSDRERITFKDHQFLIPGFWLDIPFDWKNKYDRGDR